MAFERQGANAWPSDVTLLEYLRMLHCLTKSEIADWAIERVDTDCKRTAIAYIASALQRLENDELVYRTRDPNDARQFLYRVTK